MKKKKKYVVPERVNCILYLSTESDLWHAEEREQRQQRYVLEYCKAHGINVVKTLHRDCLRDDQIAINKSVIWDKCYNKFALFFRKNLLA